MQLPTAALTDDRAAQQRHKPPAPGHRGVAPDSRLPPRPRRNVERARGRRVAAGGRPRGVGATREQHARPRRRLGDRRVRVRQLHLGFFSG